MRDVTRLRGDQAGRSNGGRGGSGRMPSAAVMQVIARTAGNRGMGTLTETINAGAEAGVGLLMSPFAVRVSGSVGRGGRNDPPGVEAVRGRPPPLRVLDRGGSGGA